MTQLLEKAYGRLIQLPKAEQDTMASLILEELDSEEKWIRKFAVSYDALSRLPSRLWRNTGPGVSCPSILTPYELTDGSSMSNTVSDTVQ